MNRLARTCAVPVGAPVGTEYSALPIDRVIIEQAAEWFVRLTSGQCTETQRVDCQRWREQCPEHERAWQRLEGISRGLKDSVTTVAPNITRDTLRVSAGARQTRRRFLQGLAGFALVGMVPG